MPVSGRSQARHCHATNCDSGWNFRVVDWLLLMKRKHKVPQQIAQSLGVSLSTVYAALQNRTDISESTRKRVREKAREMNYRADLVARSLATRETHVIAAVVPDLAGSFFVEVVKGIESAFSRAGYHLILCTTGEDAAREDQEVETLIGKRVDGLILASAHAPGSLNVLGRLTESGTPFVLIDRRLPGVDFVGADDIKVGYLATRHLIEEGYRRIAHLRGPNVSTASDRYNGYLKALREWKLKPRQDYVVEARYHEEASGAEGMEKLLRLSPRPDAVFAASDPIAIGALETALAQNIRVPEELGIVGVGSHRYTPYLRVALTTVDQGRMEIGRRAAQRLLAQIKGAASTVVSTLIEPRLIVRESSRRNSRGATALAAAAPGNSRASN
jgi:LacI family transcriptional regulator